MANNQNNKDFAKSYQQKTKQNAQNINSYEGFQQEAAAELTKPSQNFNTNTQQYNKNQYKQEAGSEFLGNNQAGENSSGYIIPDLNEESGMGINANKTKRANKNNLNK